MREDKLHRRAVVENGRDEVGDGRGDDGGQAKSLRQQHEPAVVDHKGDRADCLELEELFEELFDGHGCPMGAFGGREQRLADGTTLAVCKDARN